MDGWLVIQHPFYNFSLYQDHGWVQWKAVCNGTLFTIEKIPAPGGARTYQHLTYWATGDSPFKF